LIKRVGNYFYEFIEKSGMDTSQSAFFIANEYLKAHRKPKTIFIDAIGVGSGVVARLNESDFREIPTIGIKVSNKADDDLYLNKRAELTYRLREALEDEGKMVNDDMAIGELVAQRFEITEKGQTKIIEKKKIKEELGRSPDRSDAMILTCSNIVVTNEYVDALHERRLDNEFGFNNEGDAGSW
ncbi:MAG: hypothetical protein U9N42_05920, partial [Campylobacterota bacterium]|nr:hypothetical protein [Campylobacterota bacterium]